MSELKVVRGNPSADDLAAVVAVLLAVGPQRSSAAPHLVLGSGAARGAGWNRARHSPHVQAGSWRHVS
ncbi:acyl-CoA carboxylase subunit epsilon [Streptomyces sp. ISL-1]|uniref:acyl-CoA carboxylase epsilon subunit n=1 Tax=Streptomyces sp. ISL-1 TaxID=2817657 RepID=UPI001BEC3BFD|nr:acyl-CoA carboxylase epsilon subunit [Streptomyces sp. ISL-1]MBT2389308.1 acyl-CoA carboxylase subunit epsilon [Streptomyces sp. ISL-1]